MSNGSTRSSFLTFWARLRMSFPKALADVDSTLAASVALLLSGLTASCTPAIGDRCGVSSDCSIQGNRTCDTSQPNGYCTILGCTANSCPDNAACVVFGASVLGCAYDDYGAPSRTGRAMCLKTCSSDTDCRQSEGYVCAQLSQPPWRGGPPWTAVLDTNTSQRVCVVAASSTEVMIQDAAVCSSERPVTPPLDAMVTLEDAAPDVGDAGIVDSPTTGDAGGDVQADAVTADVGVDVQADGMPADAGADAQADAGAGDAQAEATLDALADSGVFDAQDGE
jgi:hypothetical protein